jgi:IS30 family transposase
MLKIKSGEKQKKKRLFKQFSLEERIRIEVRYRDGYSMREIAEYIGNGRNVSSVSREIGGKPNKGLGKYIAYINHEKALDKRFGKKTVRLKNDLIRDYVIKKMRLGWSPEQISIRLPKEHKGESISYEAIYQYVYMKVKGDHEDLRKYLVRRHIRRNKKGFRKGHVFPHGDTLPSIEDRPKKVEKRKEIGHFEDDCIVSRQSKDRIKSINERSTGIVFFSKMKDGTKEESTRVVCERLKYFPSPYLKTLTRDRGTENMDWQTIENTLHLKVYFAHPYCSHERGSNENLNGLFRRFFPKKTDFSKVTDEEIRRVEYLINTRPRKRFGGKTPLEVLLEKTGVAITY